MPLRWIPLLLCLFAAACDRALPLPPQTSANAGQSERPAPAQRKPQTGIDWSPVLLEAGDAWIDCGSDYLAGDGRPVLSLEYVALRDAAAACRATGLLRLRYEGKVTASFAALAERTGKVLGDLGIDKRILDIDSAGGHVEAAIRAGDAIGENDWTLWVRGDSLCHSACVLLLAAGDMRVIAGPVGIHRMVRVGSSATSRKELGEELRSVSDDLRNYLERNGASSEVYDLMTTVPNRTLRLLEHEDLERYGLAGPNAVEDDLNRIRLARRCGTEFVRRRDAFRRAYDEQCTLPASDTEGQHQDVVDINACGLKLRSRFGFPDAGCPDDSPMAELDRAMLAMPELPDYEGEGVASTLPASGTVKPSAIKPPMAPPASRATSVPNASPEPSVGRDVELPVEVDDATR